eukprot:10609492-Karenia_brevis.AAC.1
MESEFNRACCVILTRVGNIMKDSLDHCQESMRKGPKYVAQWHNQRSRGDEHWEMEICLML